MYHYSDYYELSLAKGYSTLPAVYFKLSKSKCCF